MDLVVIGIGLRGIERDRALGNGRPVIRHVESSQNLSIPPQNTSYYCQRKGTRTFF